MQNNRFEKLSRFQRGIVIVIFLLSIEISSRALFWAFDRPMGDQFVRNEIHHVYTPYIGLFNRPFKEVRKKLSTDRHGFIHQGRPNRNLFVKNKKEFRIFILGGSSVAGTFVASENTTLAAVLEDRIKEEFKNQKINLIPKVINAGVGGFYSSQSFALLKWYLLPLKPDYVIFFNGSNDALNHNSFEGGTAEILKHDVAAYHLNIFQKHDQMLTISGVLKQFFYLAGEYSAFISLVYKTVSKFDRLRVALGVGKKASQDEVDSTIRILLEQYRRNILASIGVCNQFKIGIAYFLQPVLSHNQPNLTDKELEIFNSKPYNWHNRNYFTYRNKFYDGASLMFKNLKKTNFSSSVIIEDFSSIFNPENKKRGETFWGDHVHYTDAGRITIVSEMIKRIRGDIVKKARAVEIGIYQGANASLIE